MQFELRHAAKGDETSPLWHHLTMCHHNAPPASLSPAPSQSTPYPTLNPVAGAKWIKRLTQDRLGRFVSGNFRDVNLGAALFLEREDGKRRTITSTRGFVIPASSPDFTRSCCVANLLVDPPTGCAREKISSDDKIPVFPTIRSTAGCFETR
jgi:hypothetical protein